MRVTFRMPDCDDWTDEAIAGLLTQERKVKVTNTLQWGKPVATGSIVGAVRDGHDALITVEIPEDDDRRVMDYLRITTGRDEFSLPDEPPSTHALRGRGYEPPSDVTVETDEQGPVVTGMCGFMRDPLRLFEVSVQPNIAVPDPEGWKR